MIETELQNDYVVDFLCRRADGLKYREVKNTTVNNDLFIPTDLREFVSEQSPVAWRNLKQNYSCCAYLCINKTIIQTLFYNYGKIYYHMSYDIESDALNQYI